MGREWEEGTGRIRREEEYFLWEDNGKKGVEGNRREEEDLLWKENGKKGVEGKTREEVMGGWKCDGEKRKGKDVCVAQWNRSGISAGGS